MNWQRPRQRCTQRISKSGYNVTTPQQAWVYWNTLQHQRTAGEGFDIRDGCMRGAPWTGQRLGSRSSADIDVDQLFPNLRSKQNATLPKQDPSLNFPEQSRLQTHMYGRCQALSESTVVLGFGSIPYSAVSLRGERLRAVISDAVNPSASARSIILPAFQT